MLGNLRLGKMLFFLGLSPGKIAFFLAPEFTERLRRGVELPTTLLMRLFRLPGMGKALSLFKTLSLLRALVSWIFCLRALFYLKCQ